MVFGIAAVLGAAVGEHATQLHLVSIKERQDTVVEQVGGGDRRLAVVQLGEGHLGVGVDEGLLVDPPNPFHGANVKGVLGSAVAGALALELTMRILLGLGLLQSRHLALSQD